MITTRFIRATALALLVVVAGASKAHDYIPGEPQSQPILLKGGDLYTVSDGVKEATDLLFENGTIAQIGAGITPPENCMVIDVTGKHVYPGLIASYSALGLIEISAVRATLDHREIGRNNADVKAHIAYNPDSEIIPTIRSNGVSTALVAPYGSLIRGQAGLMNMDGWTKEDAAEQLEVAMVMSWPDVRIRRGWYIRQTPEEQAKRNRELREAVWDIFETARHYKKARLSDPDTRVDQRLEEMIPLFGGDMPLLVEADDARQIRGALDLAREYDLRIIILGGFDSWRLADRLKEQNVPVIYTSSRTRTQQRSYEPQNLNYTIPLKLHEAGIRFAISDAGTTRLRDIAYEAAMMAAHGLPKEAALRAITLSPAEIFGVDNRIGSLEVGKKATIVVSDGDIMEHSEVNVTHMWIGGAAVDLSDKHKELYEKYDARPVAE